MVVGIIGGIGAGKSVVSKLVKAYGYPMFDSDMEAKYLMLTSDTIRERLVALLGTEVYRDGVLNKPFLAAKIFSSDAIRHQVNSIVHPEVLGAFKVWASRQRQSLLFIECAILFESGLDVVVDKIVVVDTPIDERIERVMKRDRCTREEVYSRIQAQHNSEFLLSKADYVINNAEYVLVIPQLEEVLTQLTQSISHANR